MIPTRIQLNTATNGSFCLVLAFFVLEWGEMKSPLLDEFSHLTRNEAPGLTPHTAGLRVRGFGMDHDPKGLLELTSAVPLGFNDQVQYVAMEDFGLIQIEG